MNKLITGSWSGAVLVAVGLWLFLATDHNREAGNTLVAKGGVFHPAQGYITAVLLMMLGAYCMIAARSDRTKMK